MTIQAKYKLIAALIDGWEKTTERTLGIDELLRLRQLLESLPDDADLKVTLSPLFAKSKEEQTEFYALYEKIILENNDVEAAQPKTETPQGTTKAPSVFSWFWFNAKSLRTALLILLFFLRPISFYTSDESYFFTGRVKNIQYEPILKIDPAPIPEGTLPFKNHVHTPDLSTLDIKSGINSGWRIAYESPSSWLLMAIITALLVAIGWWIRRRRQKFILTQKPNTKGPYNWQVTIPNAENKIPFEETFYMTANQMRRRSDSENHRLDLARSIRATILGGGIPQLKFRQLTQPNEYLVLIDRHSAQNHRAQLFNLLYQAFVAQEVLIERFYYDGDLRLCWNEQNRHGITLKELQQQFPSHRLLILGSAMSLLSPMSGKLVRWATIFDAWRIRALLTPRPPSDWDAREMQLATKFRLLPATLKGLTELVDTLEVIEPKDFRLWKKVADEDNAPLRLPNDVPQATLLTLLESEFTTYSATGQRDDRLMQWLAACAVSPVLHWDWTLHVATLIDKDVAQNAEKSRLLSVQALFKLNRLPWFVEGKIPESARLALIEWLTKHHPSVLNAVRTEWQEVLENNEPPTDSVAFEDHRMQMVLNELSLNPSRRRRNALENELERLLPIAEPDALVVDYLNRKETALDNVLPARFRRFAKMTEGTYFDRKSIVNQLVWQVPIGLVCFLGLFLQSYANFSTKLCNGAQVKYRGKNICIATESDFLTLNEVLITEFLSRDTSEPIAIDTTSERFLAQLKETFEQKYDVKGIADYDERTKQMHLNGLRANNMDSASFCRNWVIGSYNVLAEIYNRGNRDSACLVYNVLKSWHWADSVLTTDDRQKLANICTDAIAIVDEKNLMSANGFVPNECCTIAFNQGTNVLIFRQKPLTATETQYINEAQRTQKETTQSRQISQNNYLGTIKDGQNVIYLAQEGNWFKINNLATNQTGYIIAAFAGIPTLRKGCDTPKAATTNPKDNKKPKIANTTKITKTKTDTITPKQAPKIKEPTPLQTDIAPEQKEYKEPNTQSELKTHRVRLIVKGETRNMQISIDGQPVDKYFKGNPSDTPQYVEFQSARDVHTVTFKRDGISCTVENVRIVNEQITVAPCTIYPSKAK